MQVRAKHFDTIIDAIKNGTLDSDGCSVAITYYPQTFDSGKVISSDEIKRPKKYYLFSRDGYKEFNRFYYCCNRELAKFCRENDIKHDKKSLFVTSKITDIVHERGNSVSREEIYSLVAYFKKQFVFDHNPPKSCILEQLKLVQSNNHVVQEDQLLKNTVRRIMDIDYNMIVLSKEEDDKLTRNDLSDNGSYYERLRCLGINNKVKKYAFWQRQEITTRLDDY